MKIKENLIDDTRLLGFEGISTIGETNSVFVFTTNWKQHEGSFFNNLNNGLGDNPYFKVESQFSKTQYLNAKSEIAAEFRLPLSEMC